MKIQVFKSNKLLKEFEIDKSSFVLGRADDCNICILDENIARKHVEFKVSKKGTLSFSKKAKFGLLYKNNEEVTEGELLPGENLDVGDIRIAFSSGKEKQQATDFDFFTMSMDPETIDGEVKKEEEAEKSQPKIDVKKVTETKEKGSQVQRVAAVKEKPAVKEESAVKEEPEPMPAARKAAEAKSDATVIGHSLLLYQLTAISGPHKDKVFSIDKDITVIGRAKKAGIVLLDDMVSREHARLYKQGADYYILDLNSANGVKVNGKKITDPVPLGSGDIVEIGSSTLRFMIINPQVQSVQSGIGVSSKSEKAPVVEKIFAKKSEREMRKIEESYGIKDEQRPGGKKMLLPVLVLIILGITAVIVISTGKKQPPKEPPKAPIVEEKKDETPEVKCEEQGSFCQQPLAVQNQLKSEYDVAVKLFKNFQFELAEDRAQQILAKVPDWAKAKELLDLAGAEKEKLFAQKKEEEDAQVRKTLERKIAGYLREASELMRKEQYEKVKELISKVFEMDPSNEEAKKLADQIDAVFEKQKKIVEQRARYLAALSKYQSILKDAKHKYENKEYRKAIEAFQKCLGLTSSDADAIKQIKDECKTLSAESQRLLQESITPELTIAMEAYNNEQYRDAIASYNRVLKLDYTNKTAKQGIERAGSALNDMAKERFSRAAIAESVSDFATACSLYYSVIEIALPGTKYYEASISKVRKRCNAKL